MDDQLDICIEYENLPESAAGQFKMVCDFGKGRWSYQGCPRDQVYVGCRLSSGAFSETMWELRPGREKAVKDTCPGQVVYGNAAASVDGGADRG